MGSLIICVFISLSKKSEGDFPFPTYWIFFHLTSIYFTFSISCAISRVCHHTPSNSYNTCTCTTMPRRKIREYQAKKLLSSNINAYFPLNLRCAQVTPETDYSKLLGDNHWLDSERLVVKPDMLFGKRGKNNLVLLNATYPEAQKFIEERINKPITIGIIKKKFRVSHISFGTCRIPPSYH